MDVLKRGFLVTGRWLAEWWPLLLGALGVVCLYLIVERVVGSFLPADSQGITDDCFAFCVSDEESVRASLGALGDVVGGLLNPFLTFLTIFLLIRTLKQSQDSLKLTRDTLDKVEEQNGLMKEALDDSRAEMERNTAELEKAADAQESIMETQRIQRISYAFFEHYRLYIEQRNYVVGSRLDSEAGIVRGLLHMCFNTANNEGNIARVIHDRDLGHEFQFGFLSYFVSAYKLAEGRQELLDILKRSLTPDLKSLIIVFACFGQREESAELHTVLNEGIAEGQGFLQGEYLTVYGTHNQSSLKDAADCYGVGFLG